MKYILFTLAILSLNLKADNFNTSRLNKKILPPKIVKMIEGDHSYPSIIKILGKANLKEENTLYYIFNDYKYALSIELSNNRLQSFTYIIREQQITYKQIKNITSFSLPSYFPKSGHRQNAYFEIKEINGPYHYKFKNNSKQSLYSLTWKRKKE